MNKDKCRVTTKVLIVFGTRPEAIKMAPLVKAFQEEKYFDLRVCVTAQHREMLDQVLSLFDIQPDYDLNVMKSNQGLYEVTSEILLGMKTVLEDFSPDLVFVHGDTTTAFSVALAAFYKKIKIAHVEAGLRTYKLDSPWPEEANRQLTGVLANYHFAPTVISKDNLINEGKDRDKIIVTGNTVIDALYLALDEINSNKCLKSRIISSLKRQMSEQYFDFDNKKFILVTGHRRENHGQGVVNICSALRLIAKKNPDVSIVYPVHMNPNVLGPVRKLLSNVSNIVLIEPLQYEEFIYLMDKSLFIITDSGGVQEEAPSLGKPVLVMREDTERPEAVSAGTVKLVGTNVVHIVEEAEKLINDSSVYQKMSRAHNPYGDGNSCKKILEFLKKEKF
ncbi:non-hydrolyzing UDP-N-acetylglucosamine 2-epimerase [Thiomicrorhabdus sediminis]|uniref:UDP-N-acetylglucosamine 2-epimerase n=1 Tax=Thiomicrorhabdus sediminis TaxID=2580412 RepID=A0A4P9K4B3_9GAMM|nr:UDP-N-acetylglucosamine 2-epimerase (non-hydrolyzing) [Thiomicrorhabdus sediminis]QCU89541.1 UDP-N-acetylglucosamine 2-epimerase (non-hydrolyzing) [Thiomicrorhabdus sediminis]